MMTFQIPSHTSFEKAFYLSTHPQFVEMDIPDISSAS